MPYPELLELDKGAKNDSSISITTANIFMKGVRSGEIPYKVISAFTPYMDKIIELTKNE